MMKHLFLFALCLLPGTVLAARISDCDHVPYDLVIQEGGTSRTVKLSPTSGPVQVIAPVVTFEIPGRSKVTSYLVDDEYCVWSGHIDIQRVLTRSGGHS